MARRRTRVVGTIVLLLFAGAAILVWGSVRAFFGEGSTRIEAWCGRQLVEIVGDHLTPILVLDEVDYLYPRTLYVTGLRLVAGGVAIIEAESARIELAEIPKRGQPCVIAAVDLQRPQVRFVELDDGSLLGFSDFVKPGPGRDLDDGGSTRLSDVLAIDRITVTDGLVEYLRPNEPAMRLRPITLEVHRDAEGTGDEAGWYAFDAEMALAPVAQLDARVRINLDTGVLDLREVDLTTALGPEHYQLFPPPVQRFLLEHAIEGQLTAKASGVVPLRDAGSSTVTLQVRLLAARCTFADFVLPIDVLNASANLSERVLEIESARFDALGGQAEVWGRFGFDDPQRPFELRAHGSGFRIEDSLGPERSDSQLAGRVDFTLELGGRSRDLPGSLDGEGEVSLSDGRLAERPWLKALMATMSLMPLGSNKDHGHATVSIAGDHIHTSDLEMVVSKMGIRGEAELFYDGRLDMRLAAGPLERLTGALGKLGDLIGQVTDRLNTYHVTGTIAEPVVKVRPLGIGVKKPERGEGEND